MSDDGIVRIVTVVGHVVLSWLALERARAASRKAGEAKEQSEANHSRIQEVERKVNPVPDNFEETVRKNLPDVDGFKQ